MNIEVPVSFRIRVFSGYMPRSGIAGSCGVSIFSFLRNFHTVLPGGLTIYSSQDKEATKMSIDKGMDKEDVVHIYSGILFSHKNK